MGPLDATFGAFLAVITVLIVTPGPDTALVTRNALSAGRRAASLTTLGIAAGSAVWALASVLGLAVLLDQSVTVFTIFKLVGAAYLGYLGIKSLLALRGSKRIDTATPLLEKKQMDGQTAFRQGLLSILLNPKAGAIFATVWPTFIPPDASPWRLVLMLIAYETILLLWLQGYGYLVSRAGQSRFGKRIQTVLQGVTGAVLLALGVRLALEQK
jgi:RhtB (resistance to homoserine/threonine) family protein